MDDVKRAAEELEEVGGSTQDPFMSKNRNVSVIGLVWSGLITRRIF